jgi:hypothetical protein
VYAWTAGAPHGALMASLMVVMAVGLELSKPLAVASAFAAFRSWALARGAALALLASVSVAYSLTAELTLMATARGDLVAERAASSKLAKSTDGQRGRIEGELVRLSATRPAATVRAGITGMLADARIGDCSIMDGPRSKAACPIVNKLRAELGNAERREKLEADLAELRPTGATVAATDKPADPGAHALSVYLAAIGLGVPAGLLTDWLTLVPVLALEIGPSVCCWCRPSAANKRRLWSSSVANTLHRHSQLHHRACQTAENRHKLTMSQTQRRAVSERRNARLSERTATPSVG